ncbi:MAG: ATP-binding protein [Acidobacteriota bacterium]
MIARSRVSAYSLALATVAVAIGLRLILWPFVADRAPFITLFAAVIFAAWYGGKLPGLLAAIASALGAAYFILEPRNSFAISQPEYRVGLGLYLALSIATVLLIDSLSRALAEANQKRELLRTTLASIGDGVITTDVEGSVTRMNPVAESLTGWSADKACGMQLESVFKIINEESRNTVENPVTKSLREGTIVGLANHTLLIAKDGTERPIDDSAAPIKSPHGEVSGAVLVFRDVTENRKQERERRIRESTLAGQNRVLEMLVEGEPLPDVLDALCEVIERQGQQQKLVATVLLMAEDGQRLHSVAGHRAPAEYALAIDGVVIGPNVGSCGTAAFRGEQVIVSDIATDPLWADYRDLAMRHGFRACWSTPIMSSHETVLGTFAVYADTPRYPTSGELQLVEILTRTAGIAVERRRDEKTLRDADRRKDEFLATLAHELRNPLAPITNSLELMKRANGNKDLIEQSRATMERQIEHMVRLIDDLLDVSRITNNKLELKTRKVELASIIHHALEACRPQSERAGHKLGVDLPQEPIYLRADSMRLAQVFGNLLNNSCKYTKPGGRIWVTAEKQDGVVQVRVKDTGVGIPTDMLPRVFDLFTQVDRSRELSEGGLGIGLSLVKWLVEKHDGSVTAHSDGPGAGSEFVVRLPVVAVDAETEEPVPAVHPAAYATRRRILIVDDNQDNADSLDLLLRLSGNDTRTAADGVEAVEVAGEFLPDVILLDIGLPRMNGYETCQTIRQKPWGKDVIMVALTGWGQDEDRRKAKDAGFDGHMVKPVNHEDLMETLDVLTEKAGRKDAGWHR